VLIFQGVDFLIERVMTVGALRKVQQTPGGTFFVCLPKRWAVQSGLVRGTVLVLSETGDGRLLVDARHDAEVAPRSAVLKPGPYLGRDVIGKYLLGFDVIRVESKEGIGLEVRDTVKKAASHLVGLEIVEEDSSAIVLQCLLEPSGFVPEKILRRAYSIASGMHRDVVTALVEGNLQMAKGIMARDDEGNRLYFMLVRILRTIVQNPGLSEKLGVSPIECLDYRLAASLVEAIGDECVRIASKTMELEGSCLGKDLKKQILSFHDICLKAHENALTAFLTGNIAVAEDVRNLRENVDRAFGEIEKSFGNQSLDIMPKILAATAFMRQIYEHSVDISDLAAPRRAQEPF